ncbi:mediator of RNA polymerase II transcription subunit 1 [Biomphalaria pfeifferi]|uniref:Mediator of RNA polymerase II transcription subunit 1 n=1 Tax=Biomphalaria pfeifferi TaxID=112525 RepID=A0AAD8BJ59_BIOPF|nr:mediator of RNA polymerase II transcription subunit 1 [Biomphalaria pfeifferi]
MPTPKNLPKTLPVTPEQEGQLWENKQLSLESSAGLIHAVIFYLIKCFGVWEAKYLKLLTTEHVKYDEDKLGKFVTIDTTSIAKAGKVIRRYDDPENPRSLYKIIKIYQGYLANEGPLLVRPISSIKDYICYSPWPLGVGIVDQTAQNLLKDLGDQHLYTNASISLMAIETLKNIGVGTHCMGTWTQQLYSLYTKSNAKDVFGVCMKTNCEKKNLNLCLLISRLLDPPYPPDRADVAELENKKLKLVDVFFESQLTSLSSVHPDDDDVIYEKTEEIVKEKNTKKFTDSGGNKKNSNLTKRHRLSKRGSKSGCETFSPRFKKRKTSKNVQNGLNENSSLPEKAPVKIISVSSIPESSFSVQRNEDKMSLSVENDKLHHEETKDNQLVLENIKKENVDEGDDLPLTFIKKEIIDEADNKTMSQPQEPLEDRKNQLTEIKVDLDDLTWPQNETQEEHCLSTENTVILAAVPKPSVDSILLLRKLWKQEAELQPHDLDKSEYNQFVPDTKLGMNVDLSPPVLSPQTKSTDADDNVDIETARQLYLLPSNSQPTSDNCVKTSPPADNGVALATANISEPISCDSHKATESQFVLSNFPSKQSTKISTSPLSSFPLLMSALKTAIPQEASAIIPSLVSTRPVAKSRKKFKTLKRSKVLSSRLCNSTNLKQRLKSKIATSSVSDNAEYSSSPKKTLKAPTVSSAVSGNNVPVFPSNSSLLNSPLAQLQPHSGIYHLSSDQEKQAAYQTVKIRTDSGTKLFTIGDQHLEQSASSMVLTSETNIGDYFPEGTMIPANGLKLLTRNGPNGLEVLLKFEYTSGSSSSKKQ